MSDNSCQIKSVFRGQKFIKKHCCREDAQIKTDNTEKLPDKEVRFCLFSQPFSLLSSEGGKKTELDHFTDLDMAQMQLHKQSQTDEAQVLNWPDAGACGRASRRFLHFYPSELVKTT